MLGQGANREIGVPRVTRRVRREARRKARGQEWLCYERVGLLDMSDCRFVRPSKRH
jgi:hypothetical protein